MCACERRPGLRSDFHYQNMFMLTMHIFWRSTIGAGDTFIAGMLFGLVCHAHDWSQQERLAFATELATKKVQIDGFVGLLG